MKIGDTKWFVSGYESPLTIKVTIKFIDEDFNSYWLDEPIGHGVHEDELYDNLDDALAEMKDRKEEYNTLDEFREKKAKFILSTRIEDNRTVKEFLKDLPPKTQNVDWFN